MKKFLLSLFLVISCATCFGYGNEYEYLRVGDVRTSWTTVPGSIDSSTIYVEPKGLYAEIQLYMYFSPACTNYNGSQDSLEVQMGFNLPSNAEITDMWLWVGNVAVRAYIIDRWSASQIYNGIVNRRKDPALLTKQSSTFYTLNVFPMNKNMQRKVKLTYQIPISKLTGHGSLIPLPFNILRLSNCPINKLHIAYKPSMDLDNPRLPELPGTVFTQQTNGTFGQHYAAEITNLNGISSLSISVSRNQQTDYFATTYPIPNTTQGVYQVELNISHLLGIQSQRKTLFLLDFVKANSSMSRNEVLQTLKGYLQSYFEAGDSINFMFSGFYTNMISNKWISADSVEPSSARS